MRDTVRFFLPGPTGVVELPLRLVAMSVYNDLPLCVSVDSRDGKTFLIPDCFADGSGVEVTVRRVPR